MHSSDRERLLAEVIHDEDYAAFRRRAFVAARREIRKRRRGGHMAVWLALAAAVALMAAIWWPPNGNVVKKAQVETVPLIAETAEVPLVEIVTTKPAAPEMVVRTLAEPNLIVETTEVQGGMVQVVHTQPSYLLEVTDEQVLALFGGAPVGWMESESGKSLIVFE